MPPLSESALPKTRLTRSPPRSTKQTLHELPLELDSTSNFQFNLWWVSQGVRRGMGTGSGTSFWESPCCHQSSSSPKQATCWEETLNPSRKEKESYLQWFCWRGSGLQPSPSDLSGHWLEENTAERGHWWLQKSQVRGRKLQVRTHGTQKDSTKLRFLKYQGPHKAEEDFSHSAKSPHEYSGSIRLKCSLSLKCGLFHWPQEWCLTLTTTLIYCCAVMRLPVCHQQDTCSNYFSEVQTDLHSWWYIYHYGPSAPCFHRHYWPGLGVLSVVGKWNKAYLRSNNQICDLDLIFNLSFPLSTPLGQQFTSGFIIF